MTELISREELKSAIDQGSVIVVDALGGMYYEQQHLPTALPLTAEDVLSKGRELLPNKNAAIVTYCSNASCPNSQNVANLLAAAGYTDVRKYREGIQDWVTAGLSIETGAFTIA